MIDIRTLKKHGVSAGAYRKIFSANPAEYPPRIKKLVDMIAGRIREGRNLNLQEWRAYYAIDLAYDVPFNQTTPTIVQNILSKRYEKPDEIIAELRAWGISEDDLFLKTPGDDGRPKLQINPPVFFNIFIPLVKAYVSIRTANLFNERNTVPFTPYEPLKQTERNQVLCEVITDIENDAATLFGYPSVLRQAIQQMLRYGICLTFPREEWYCEKQLFTDPLGNESPVVIKEGLRYTIPHPTFTYYDLKYPLTSLNSDTGIDFAGYWHILSYGQIFDSPLYWNKKRIFPGTNWFAAPNVGNLFSEVFPCAMRFPERTTGTMTREDKASWYNTSSDRDKAVFVTEHYDKIIPKDWGLGDYKYPVWHRFTMAGDDTVIWAEPCAYNPSWFVGYDYDENAGRTSSMALEAIPWQDQLGNILSQMILTAKQNLTNVIFYDTNMVDAGEVRKMQDSGDQRYRAMQFLPYDSMKTRVQGLSAQAAFSPVQLTKSSIQELIQIIPTMLSIMERVLQVSAQEAGAQATHQQSKYELQQTGGASSNRVYFTGSFVDEGIDAWKRQRYDASMAYRDASVSAQVSADIPGVLEIVQELGFRVSYAGKEKVGVRGTKDRLRLEGFARSSQGRPPSTDREAAQVIFQCVQVISQQPDLAAKIGSKNLLAMIELGGSLAGAPRGFKLREQPDDPNQGVAPNVLNAIKMAQQATSEAIQQNIGQPVAEAMGKTQGELKQLQDVVAQLQKIYDVAARQVQADEKKVQDSHLKLQLQATETEQKIQREAAQAAAEQARKEEAHHLDQRIAAEESAAKIKAMEEESAAKKRLAAKTAAKAEK